jgi:hypothetical protein
VQGEKNVYLPLRVSYARNYICWMFHRVPKRHSHRNISETVKLEIGGEENILPLVKKRGINYISHRMALIRNRR